VDDLIAFLTARLDEDEAAAKAAETGTPWHAAAGQFGPRVTTGPGEDDHWDREISYAVWVCDDEADGCPDDSRAVMAEARHIARHDPARALREVEAKRALLRMHEPVPFWGNNPPPLKDRTPENAVAWYCECQCPDGVIQGAYPCDTARLLTAVWSDHPDYRQEWKP
jgi:hypothetical protein